VAYVRTGSVAFPERPMPLPMGQSTTGVGLGTLLMLAAAGLGFWYFLGLAEKGYRRNQARRLRRVRSPRKRKWIKAAIKKPGALRSWVKRRYGKAGFDSQGRIKLSVLRRHYHDPGTLGKRVRLAMTLRRM
jgi:hypothetical protein